MTRMASWAAFILAELFAGPVSAGHMAGGEIDLHHLNGDSYEVVQLLWKDCASLIGPPISILDYESPCGSGTLTLFLDTIQEVSMVCAADLLNTTCNGGSYPGIALFTYRATIDLPPCDSWEFSSATCCLSPMVANCETGSITCKSTLNNLLMPCRDSPRYERLDLPYTFNASALAYDLLPVIDGTGSFTSALTELLDTMGGPYLYTPPLTGSVPYPGVQLQPDRAQLEAPPSGLIGGYVMNVIGTLTDSLGNVLSTVQRYFLLVATPSTDDPPSLNGGIPQLVSGQANVTGPRSMSCWPGQNFCFQLAFPDADTLDLVTLGSDILLQLPGATATISNGNPALLSACWTPPSSAQGVNRFHVDVRDGHCPIEGRQAYGYSLQVLPDTVDPCMTTHVVDLVVASEQPLLVPNPVSDHVELFVNGRMPGPATLRLVDPVGRLVSTRQVMIHGDRIAFTTENLLPGVYLVELVTGSERVMLWMVKG